MAGFSGNQRPTKDRYFFVFWPVMQMALVLSSLESTQSFVTQLHPRPTESISAKLRICTSSFLILIVPLSPAPSPHFPLPPPPAPPPHITLADAPALPDFPHRLQLIPPISRFHTRVGEAGIYRYPRPWCSHIRPAVRIPLWLGPCVQLLLHVYSTVESPYALATRWDSSVRADDKPGPRQV